VNDVYIIQKAEVKPKKAGNVKLPAKQCARQEAREQHLADHRDLTGESFRIKGFPTRTSIVLINTKSTPGKPGLIKTSLAEFHRWDKIKEEQTPEVTK